MSILDPAVLVCVHYRLRTIPLPRASYTGIPSTRRLYSTFYRTRHCCAARSPWCCARLAGGFRWLWLVYCLRIAYLTVPALLFCVEPGSEPPQHTYARWWGDTPLTLAPTSYAGVGVRTYSFVVGDVTITVDALVLPTGERGRLWRISTTTDSHTAFSRHTGYAGLHSWPFPVYYPLPAVIPAVSLPVIPLRATATHACL